MEKHTPIRLKLPFIPPQTPEPVFHNPNTPSTPYLREIKIVRPQTPEPIYSPLKEVKVITFPPANS